MEELSKLLSETTGAIILYFSTATCGPCKSIGPQVESFVENKGVKLVKIDALEQSDLASMFAVKKVPTFISVKDQKILQGLYGNSNLKEIKDLINEALEL